MNFTGSALSTTADPSSIHPQVHTLWFARPHWVLSSSLLFSMSCEEEEGQFPPCEPSWNVSASLLSDCLYTIPLILHNDGSGNPHIRGGKGFYLSLFSFFPSLSPSVLFLKSWNTGKICKPWSGNSGFSQWEHSVIPAGLCRRVNTFFSQARNSLAGERVRQRGREDRRRDGKSKRGGSGDGEQQDDDDDGQK